MDHLNSKKSENTMKIIPYCSIYCFAVKDFLLLSNLGNDQNFLIEQKQFPLLLSGAAI